MPDAPPGAAAPDVSPFEPPFEYDETFLDSRREALVILGIWGLAFAWAVPYCYLNGYLPAGGGEIATVWGLPAWAVWGIGLPWLVADLLTVWFCFGYMKDADLGEAHEGADVEEEVARREAERETERKQEGWS